MIDKRNLNTLKNDNTTIKTNVNSLGEANEVGKVEYNNNQVQEEEQDKLIKDNLNNNFDQKLADGKEYDLTKVLRKERRYKLTDKQKEYLSAGLRDTTKKRTFQNFAQNRLMQEEDALNTKVPKTWKKWVKNAWKRKQRGRIAKAREEAQKFEKMISALDTESDELLSYFDRVGKQINEISEEDLIKELEAYQKQKNQAEGGNADDGQNGGNQQEEQREYTDDEKKILKLQKMNDAIADNALYSVEKYAYDYDVENRAEKYKISFISDYTIEKDKTISGDGAITLYEKEKGVNLYDLEKLFFELASAMKQKANLVWDAPKANDDDELLDEEEHKDKNAPFSIKGFIDRFRKLMKWTEDDSLFNNINEKMPADLVPLIEEDGRSIMMNSSQDFEPQKHLQESLVLLMSAVSTTLYDYLNDFAVKKATDEKQQYKLTFKNDEERSAWNFDLLNKQEMHHLLQIRNMSFASAKAIRENRKEISTIEEPLKRAEKQKKRTEKILEKNTDQKAGTLHQDAKESGLFDEKAPELKEDDGLTEEEKQKKLEEEVLKEWRDVIEHSFQGRQEKDDGLKKVPWVLNQFTDQLIEHMKTLDVWEKKLRGPDLWQYLDGVNDKVNHNLRNLDDEVEKSDIGVLCYNVPRLQKMLKDYVKKDWFAFLTVEETSFRDMFCKKELKSYFQGPQFIQVRNRQRAIMECLNRAVGVPGYYQSSKQLENLWKIDAVQDLLLRDISKATYTQGGYKIDNESFGFGTMDDQFLNDMKKFETNVIVNMNIIDDKIKQKKICKDAKDVLRLNICKQLGGEYLLGYSYVNEAYVDYVCDNMMIYNGEAMAIQRRWEKFFNKTGLPSRISDKVEERVGNNAASKSYNRFRYFLKVQTADASEEDKHKQKLIDNNTKVILGHIKKLYKSEIKDFFKKEMDPEMKIKLTKGQWERLEDKFEDIWLKEFSDVYNSKTYKSSRIKADRGHVKFQLQEELNKIKTEEVDPEETLISNEEYKQGLKSNNVIEYQPHLVDEDMESQIFKYDAFEKILKKKADRDAIKDMLNKLLKDKESPLHKKYPYLDGVYSIEQVGKLGLVDYSKFFEDVKYNLTGMGGKDVKKQKRLVLDKWIKTTWHGQSVGNIKDKLLEKMLVGDLTYKNFDEELQKLKDEAIKDNDIQKMRIDAIIDRNITEEDLHLEYSYLKIQGHATKLLALKQTELKQPERIKRCNYASKLWQMINEYDKKNNTAMANKTRNILYDLLTHLKADKVLVKDGRSYNDFLKGSKVKETAKEIKPEKVVDSYKDNLTAFAEAFTFKKNKKQEFEPTKKFNNLFNNRLIYMDATFSPTFMNYMEEFNKLLDTMEVNDYDSGGKLQFKDFITEFLMLGMQNQVLGEGKRAEESFLTYDDKKYVEGIVNVSSDILTRRKNVEEILKQIGNPIEEARILRNLEPVIAGIDDSNPEQNLQRYGVSGTMDLMAYLQKRYEVPDMKFKGEVPTQEEIARIEKEGLEKAAFINSCRQNAAMYEERRAFINTYDGGKFRLVADYILSDKNHWNKIMSCTDDEFVDYMNELNTKFGKALDAFASDGYKNCYSINRQYLMSNFKTLEEHPDWDVKQWQDEIDKYYTTFMDARIPGRHSINEILTAVEKEGAQRRGAFYLFRNCQTSLMHMKLSYVLQSDPSAFTVLYRERDIRSVLEKFDERLEQNFEYMNNMMKEAKEKTDDKSPEMEMMRRIAQIYDEGQAIRKKLLSRKQENVINSLDEKKKLTEEDEKYANFSLLEQTLYSYAAIADQAKFKEEFLTKCKFFLNKVDEIRMPEDDRTFLDYKAKVQLSIESKKREGEIAENELLKKEVEYREKRERFGSPIMVAYGAKKAFDQKSINKAREFVTELFEKETNKPTKFVTELLVERYLSLRGGTEDRATRIKLDKEKLMNLDKLLREKKKENGTPMLLERDVRKALVYAYAQNASRLEGEFNGAEEGQVDTIIKEFLDRQEVGRIPVPVSGLAKLEYDEFKRDMDVAFYTMKPEEYKEVIDAKKKYFNLLDRCCKVIDETGDSTSLAVKAGLLDYFRKDIIESVKNETSVDELENNLKLQINNLIGDGVTDDGDIMAEDIRRYNLSYLANSKSMLGQVSDKSVTAVEKISSTRTYNRTDLERIIAETGNEEMITYYNRLTVEEQKVFAIALSFPDMNMTASDGLGSNVVLKDSDRDREKAMDLQNQLSAFIYDKKFAPRIDYNLAVRRLQKIDKKTGLVRVSKTMFKNALTYTRFCIQKKNEMKPKDWARMSDGSFTMYEGRMLRNKEGEAEKLEKDLENANLNGTNAFRMFFEDYMHKDGTSQAKKLFKKLVKLNDVQMNMLILILQDRTALDYTTNDGFMKKIGKSNVPYANEERRLQIIDELTNANGMSKDMIRDVTMTVTPEQYQKAAETLFSYQMRDDINLAGKNLTYDDFAGKALDRETAVDWNVLHQAFNLLDEIEEKNRKIQVCRETVEHTLDNDHYNKKAKEELIKLNDYVRHDGVTDMDYFDDFIVKEAKKNKGDAMPLISSYFKLSSNEKLLMFHALKHRDILDVSTDSTFTTAIGLGEMNYVNEKGRNELTDYYIDHLSIAGAKNKITTWDKDVYEAMRSLLSSQVDDTLDPNEATSFAELINDNSIKRRLLRRNTAVDWTLFARALQFVKRTEAERQIFVGNKELYRSQGNLAEHGRFQYNYEFMRKNLYSSGYRLTRFIGRRLADEIKDAIPFSGMGQMVLMTVLGQENRNKMLEMGIVEGAEEKEKKDLETKVLGYVDMAGGKINMMGDNKMISDMLGMSNNVKTGFKVVGKTVEYYGKVMQGLWEVGNKFGEISDIKGAAEKSKEYEERDKKRQERAKTIQSMKQQEASDASIQRNKHILTNVAAGVATEAKREDIIDTVSDFIEAVADTAEGGDFIDNYLVGGAEKIIKEALKVTEFIMRLFSDRNMLKNYYSDNGPLSAEASELKGDALKIRLKKQEQRKKEGKAISEESMLTEEDIASLKDMSDVQIMQKAYGFQDFSEHASYVGWNIVQALLFTACPYNPNLQTKFQAHVILTAIGCKELMGKQDNESAQKLFDKLMNPEMR